jgi:hypothetical protein
MDDDRRQEYEKQILELERTAMGRITARDRRRMVHGWAFRDHSLSEVTGIYRYLATGETNELPQSYIDLIRNMS